ncbi:aquaporin-like protein [Glonium stellatum]|uniref:Aquaporin-like protein n=1 Tax=Glonium stellatum TaxID=574774 RepID=A0A8E2JQX8_9PEZI|nr:aquaporin-like protein [Glonium stellatum]
MPKQTLPLHANGAHRNSTHYHHHHPNTRNPPRSPAPSPARRALKNHLVAASGEFVGTFLFLFFGFATHLMAVAQAGEVALGTTTGDGGGTAGGKSAQTVVVVALGYGMSLLVAVWALYRISGGLFNPAVTLGLCLAGQLPWARGLIFLPTQLLAGMVAAALVQCMFPGDIRTLNTTLSPGTTVAQGVFIEMFLTAELVFAVLMLAAEKSKDTFIAPVGIGLALFVAELAGVYYTGGSLNPTRSFGPAVAGTWFPGYHWIYWVGPFLGAIVSAGYYHFVKYFNYEEANPGQDASNEDFVAD